MIVCTCIATTGEIEMSQFYIYVLHFTDPLHHAKHYVGCTRNLRQRLETHADGYGSHLTRALYEKQIEFELGTLYVTNKANMRKIERFIKKMANGPRFCQICNPAGVKVPECQTYSIELLPFPTQSVLLRQFTRKRCHVTRVRFSEESDMGTLQPILIAMQKRDKDCIGFVPTGGKETDGLDRLISIGKVALAIDGENVVGYCSYTLNPSGERVRIHQCIVADEYRLKGHARRMVEAIGTKNPTCELSCHVREDLAANHFWQSLGFKEVSRKIHPTSKSTIIYYVRSTTKKES